MPAETAEIPAFTDPFSWGRLEPEACDAFSVFDLTPPPLADDGKPRPKSLARRGALSMYLRAFADGAGESFLHAHDDDSAWLVLKGEAVFYGEGEREVARLGAGQGVLTPVGAVYRFACAGAETVMIRIAGKA